MNHYQSCTTASTDTPFSIASSIYKHGVYAETHTYSPILLGYLRSYSAQQRGSYGSSARPFAKLLPNYRATASVRGFED
jgi:hypothetical protein